MIVCENGLELLVNVILLDCVFDFEVIVKIYVIDVVLIVKDVLNGVWDIFVE